jgi:hypothetical protein
MRNMVGSPVQNDDFFERPKTIKKIWRALKNGNNIMLYAPPKSGVTSLLLHLRERELEAWLLLFEIQEIRQNLKLGNVRFIFAGASNQGSFTAMFKVYLQDVEESLEDLVSIDLTPLSKIEAAHFVNCLLENGDFQIPTNVIDYLLEQIQWLIPFHLQLVFREIADIAIDGDLDVISNKDINEAFSRLSHNKAIFDHWHRRLEDLVKNNGYKFAKNLLDILSKQTEIDLSAIANLAKNHDILDDFKGILQILTQEGYINNDENRELYRFNSGLVKAWWRNHFADESHNRLISEFKDIKVNSLKINNIKCFEDIVIDFDASNPMALIVGSNARGKTTILQLVA